MSQTHLIQCVYCGHSVSVRARACPQCQKEKFSGVECQFCHKRFPKEACVKSLSEDQESWYYACDPCATSRFTPPPNWRCVDCDAVLDSVTHRNVVGLFACPSCGSTRPFGGACYPKCHQCHFEVYKFQHGIERKTDYSRFLYHDVCAPKTVATGCLSLIAAILLLVDVLSGGWFMFQQRPSPSDGADREPPYYPAFYEFNPSTRSDAPPRQPSLILFSLDT
jgi:hypothetical protein